MTVLGIDDTDSRSGGMCTTWIATEITRRLPADSVDATYLIRLHPAVEHKTRGNGAVGIVTGCDPSVVLSVATDVIERYAVFEDPNTNPGVVVVDDVDATAEALQRFAKKAIRSTLTRAHAWETLETVDANTAEWGNARGIIGAIAAVGAVGAHRQESEVESVFSDWTYERIAYRTKHRWGTDRTVSAPPELPSGPAVWDTIDPTTGKLVCAPRSPCPVLFGIRGDDPAAIRTVVEVIQGEPIDRMQQFITNQGTDAHVRPGEIGSLENGSTFRVKGTVDSPPSTGRGGHVQFPLRKNDTSGTCLAFAPTGRFREHVRGLREGDRIIACGEADRGAIKLEKFALIDRMLTEDTVPRCPECERSMKSAGREQGYRCRRCDSKAENRARRAITREIERGWYEVPPDARRHLAKPLVRGHYALPVHPTSG